MNIHTDTLNESGFVEHTINAFRGRTIHTYHRFISISPLHAPLRCFLLSFSYCQYLIFVEPIPLTLASYDVQLADKTKYVTSISKYGHCIYLKQILKCCFCLLNPSGQRRCWWWTCARYHQSLWSKKCTPVINQPNTAIYEKYCR